MGGWGKPPAPLLIAERRAELHQNGYVLQRPRSLYLHTQISHYSLQRCLQELSTRACVRNIHQTENKSESSQSIQQTDQHCEPEHVRALRTCMEQIITAGPKQKRVENVKLQRARSGLLVLVTCTESNTRWEVCTRGRADAFSLRSRQVPPIAGRIRTPIAAVQRRPAS
jgi:hypothetical protein